MISDKNPEINIRNLSRSLDKIKSTNKYENFFFIHSKTILDNKIRLETLALYLEKLKVNEKYTNDSIKKANLSIAILFTLLVIFIIFYVIHEYKLTWSNNQLCRFKKTIENSDNIVLVTDENENIKYVNEEFTKTTGYKLDEVIGKKPNILKSGKQSKEFYTKLKETIHSGKKWSGEFINIDKFGELSYERASITPVFDNKGNIKEFISIKLDITNEIVKGQQLKEKENLLIQQSKMAAMGEMLNNIAHQWRQPLSTISTGAAGIKLQKEMNILKDEDFYKTMNVINESSQYLSQTIEDFRCFFDLKNNNKSEFLISSTINKTMNLLSSQFIVSEIKIIEKIQDISITSFENELIQVLANLLNNSKDALSNLKNQDKLIFITTYKKENNLIIEIKDNAQGIPENIIDKIFEPYFTTKHKSQGTGVGLYMSHNIVESYLHGNITAKTISYEYNASSYKGALFTISIPITSD